MSILETISRPYTQAIFQLAKKNHAISKWKNILFLLSSIATQKKIRPFLFGSLSPSYLSYIFIKISGNYINHHAKNLVKLLAYHQRLYLLSCILKQFLELELLAQKIYVVQLISAYSLKKIEVEKIKDVLENHFSKKIQFLYSIDKNILGGIILKINNTVLNFSTRDRLKKLFNALNFEENYKI